MPITKNIQANYRRKSLYCLLLLAVLSLFWISTPCREFFSPMRINEEQSIDRVNSGTRYVAFDKITLYYTGYCLEKRGNTNGYYYYGFTGEPAGKNCLFFLISPSTCNDGQESITLKNLRGAVADDTAAREMLLTGLAGDLNWDTQTLTDISQPFLIAETEYHLVLGIFAYGLLFLLTLLVFIPGCLSVLYMIKPALSPSCGCLLRPVKSARRLLQAEQELRAHCLVQGETFYITRHFLIELSETKTHILPIKELAWVYEHNGFTPLLGHHQKVRYTITYYDKRKHAVHSVYNRHSDVDTILSYLRDYYPEILNGYTAENQELFKEL